VQKRVSSLADAECPKCFGLLAFQPAQLLDIEVRQGDRMSYVIASRMEGCAKF
jgi:hypothetical protein